MRRATMRNQILAFSGTLAFLATIVVFDLGCPGSDPLPSSEPVASVTVTGPSSVVVGGTIQLTATTYKTGGLEVFGRTKTWISSAPTVASVSTSGLVTGVSVGEASITATSEGKSKSALVTVTPAPVATVSVTGPASVAVNGAAQFTATLKDAGGNVLTGRVVTWSSSLSTVASVSPSGLVTGVAAGGPVSITATSETKDGSAQVTVTPAPVFTVTVTGPASVAVNGAAQFAATLKDAGGNVLTGRVVTWSSSLSTVASVSPSGLVTGVAAGGPVSITATSETKDGSAQVTVTAPVPPAILTGRVIDFTTQTGIAGALVRFLDESGVSASFGSTSTGADGTFTAPVSLPATPGGVLIEAVATGYVTGRVLVASVPPAVTTVTETIPLVPQSSSTGGIAGTVKNARTGQGIASATVSLYNNIQVNPIASGLSDASGFFTFTGLSAGTYRLTGTATGFQLAQRTGVAVGNNSVTAGQDIVLSPTGSNDIRIVLTWGASPSDLDSHLTGPNADATRFHVYYSSRGSFTAAPFAGLDLDDTNGNGPETITIAQFNSSTGIYRYSVHDYSNRSSLTSFALGLSGAKVVVYTPGALAQTFFVPNRAGTLWTVFEMSASITNPVITVNVMSFATDPGPITSPPSDGSVKVTDTALIGRAVQQHPKAKP